VTAIYPAIAEANCVAFDAPLSERQRGSFRTVCNFPSPEAARVCTIKVSTTAVAARSSGAIEVATIKLWQGFSPFWRDLCAPCAHVVGRFGGPRSVVAAFDSGDCTATDESITDATGARPSIWLWPRSTLRREVGLGQGIVWAVGGESPGVTVCRCYPGRRSSVPTVARGVAGELAAGRV
jgi:hypothetical protein